MTAPVDVLAMMDALLAFASRGVESDDPARQMIEASHEARAAVAELIEAGNRADGDERPARPERGPGYTDAEWKVFLRGWDAHAEAVYASGMRAALAHVGAK